jgi:SAM-dependent methyltransferase
MLEIRRPILLQGADTRTAYDAFYQAQDLIMRDSFYLWLIQLLDPSPDGLLLDISCGQGKLVELAARQGLRAVGVDFSYIGLAKAQQVAPDALWVTGDGEGLPFADNSVDYVAHIGSLEHYENMVAGAREIARVLRPEGAACVLLPNAYGLFGNISYVRAHGEIFDDHQPLQRYATRRTWEAILSRGGLEVTRTIGWGEVNVPQTADDLVWMLGRPKRVVRGLVATLAPINWANQFVFLCRKGHTSQADPLYPTLARV